MKYVSLYPTLVFLAILVATAHPSLARECGDQVPCPEAAMLYSESGCSIGTGTCIECAEIRCNDITDCNVTAGSRCKRCDTAFGICTHLPATMCPGIPSVSSLSPADQSLVTITINGVDNLSLQRVLQDEPVNGACDGATSPDATLNTSTQTVQVRKERSSSGDGRVYHIYYTGTLPGTGTPCEGDVAIYVPVTSGGSALDNGPVYDSTAIPQFIVANDLGILVLDPSATGALTISGNGTATVQQGRVMVNSSNAKALTASGNAILTALEIAITGNCSANGNAQLNGSVGANCASKSAGAVTKVLTGKSADSDPFAGLDEPALPASAENGGSPLFVTSAKTINPGRYEGGISVSANGALTMNPGVYYMNGGGFSVSGNGSVTGNGVMIFNKTALNSDDVSLTGNGSVVLSAPDSGPYQGVVVFQNRASAVTGTITGNGTTDVTGALYFVGAQLSLSGNGNAKLGSMHVSRKVNISGNGSFTVGTCP